MSECKIIERMPFDEYLKIDAVNVSSLKLMGISALEYKHGLDAGNVDKPQFALGHATHTAILEPRKFLLDYTVQPETRENEKGETVKFVRSGKHWADFQEEHSGKRILKASEYNLAWDLQERVRKHPAAAKKLAAPGTFETVIIWTHRATGLLCKIRIDHLSNESADDLKTAHDITPKGFQRACYNFKYHWQAAFYSDGVEQALDKVHPFCFIPVQKAAPHDCVVYNVPGDIIQDGRIEYEEAMRKLAFCRENDTWPGISNEPIELERPHWAGNDDDDAIIVSEDEAA